MSVRIPPGPWLETLRLELRDFVTEDFDDLYRLDRDPRVMKADLANAGWGRYYDRRLRLFAAERTAR